VNFNHKELSLYRDAIDTVQVLHYKTTDFDRLLEDPVVSETAIQYNASAEVVIFYGSDFSDGQKTDSDVILRTILHCLYPN
jgi:uridylate kinase